MHCAFSWFSLLQLNETLLKKNLTYAAEYFPQWRRHVRGKYVARSLLLKSRNQFKQVQ